MEFIKEEIEDMSDPEPSRIKHEDTEEQIVQMEVTEQRQKLNDVKKPWPGRASACQSRFHCHFRGLIGAYSGPTARISGPSNTLGQSGPAWARGVVTNRGGVYLSGETAAPDDSSKREISREYERCCKCLVRSAPHSLCAPCGCHLHKSDGHTECPRCLGLAHAEAALSAGSCPLCESMSISMLRTRLALFKEDGDTAPHVLPFPAPYSDRGKRSAHLCPPTAAGWRTRAVHPSKPCRNTSALAGCAYSASDQSASALHTMEVLQVFQAKLLQAMDESCQDPESFKDLHSARNLALCATKSIAQAIARAQPRAALRECRLLARSQHLGFLSPGLRLTPITAHGQLSAIRTRSVLPQSPGPLPLHGPGPPSRPRVRLRSTSLLDCFPEERLESAP
ncbi:unnamed protein product [Leuciscus chuanchicus]